MSLKQALGRWLIPRLPLSRRSFDILRFELGCLRQRAVNALNPGFRRRVAALRARRDLSVNVGSSGYGLPGWINIDARPGHAHQTLAHDIRRPLPLADGSAARVFAEHVIEHLDFRREVPVVLRDFHRILRPGGALRIVVPDVARYLEAYVERSRERFAALGWDLDALPHDIFTPMHIVNHVFHQEGEHLFGWDFETLQWALRRAGFDRISRQTYRVSSDPALAIDRSEHARYSLYVEAVK